DLGTYREEAPKVGAYFSEEIRQYIEHKQEYGVEDLYQRGLKVNATLDIRMQQAAEQALQAGLRRWDHRRGFHKPARNLVAEGIDPANYRDPSWSNEAYAVDKLYPAVVMNVDAKSVTTRVGKDTIELLPPQFKWTSKPSMAGTLNRGDIVYVRLNEDAKTKQRAWMLDQMPQVQGAVVVLDTKS